MKTLQVTKAHLDPKDYIKRSALESDYSPQNLIKESCIIEFEGKPIVIYKCLDDEGFDAMEITSALQRIDYHTATRSGGLVSTSRIFGFSPRNQMRKDFCSATSLINDFPKEHAIVCNYGAKVAQLYAQTAPAVYSKHQALAEKALGEWKIHDSPFTSGIINKNNPLKYHYDSGNFNGVYSCMLGFKHNTAGGYLALPEYDCALEIASNSVTIFDGQSILHGVTPIKSLAEDAYRFTIVYYSLKKMWECLPLSKEIIRIRNRKTTRERNRAKGVIDPQLQKQLEKKRALDIEAETFKDVR